jgi:hypothetical protein
MFDHQVTFGGGHVYPSSGFENGFFLLFPMGLFICVVTISKETKEEEIFTCKKKPFIGNNATADQFLSKATVYYKF